ncbi:MAG TPA: hypothetical protein VG937_11495 [Polyangiaceae bacterium]|jgi:hypothetical protein|nr:hypothetical protein [Polyangiaceae bacterium]
MRALLTFAGILLWVTAAAAEPLTSAGGSRSTDLSISNCSDELAESLPAVIQLEIDVLLRESGPSRAPPERISIQCSASRVTIVVSQASTAAESSLDIAALAPDHRARAVALAAAELAHSLSHRSELPPAPPKSQPEPTSATAKPTEAAPPARKSPPIVLLGGLAEWLGEPAALLFGARLAAYYPLGTHVVPALSLDGALGGLSAQSADVAAKTLALAAHLYLGTNTGPMRWDAGPGARIGFASLSGRPAPDSPLVGRTLTAAWGGPELRARVAYGAPQRHSTVFALELGAGLVALPIRGLVDGTERIYAVQGHWLSVCAGLGLSL